MTGSEHVNDSREWNQERVHQELYLLGVDTVALSTDAVGQRSIMATADEGTRRLHFGFDENGRYLVSRIDKESGELSPLQAGEPSRVATQRTWRLLDELRTRSQLIEEVALPTTVARPKPLHERTGYAENFDDVTFLDDPSEFFFSFAGPGQDALIDDRFAFEKLGQELLLEHGIRGITIMHEDGLAFNHVAWISELSGEDVSESGYGIRQTGEVIKITGPQIVNNVFDPQELASLSCAPALEKLWRMNALLFERLPDGMAYGSVNLDQPKFRDWQPRAEVERQEAAAIKEGFTQTLQQAYLFERLLAWAASTGTTDEAHFFEQAITTNREMRRDYRSSEEWLKNSYGNEYIDSALLQSKQEADAIIERPSANDAEKMADDLYRYAKLRQLTRQETKSGGLLAQIATFAVIASAIETVCRSRQQSMQEVAQQPENSTFTQTVLDRLLNHADPIARAQAAGLSLEYATHNFSAAHHVVDKLARDTDETVRRTLSYQLFIRRPRSGKRFEGREADILNAYHEALSTLNTYHHRPVADGDIDARYLPEE